MKYILFLFVKSGNTEKSFIVVQNLKISFIFNYLNMQNNNILKLVHFK